MINAKIDFAIDVRKYCSPPAVFLGSEKIIITVNNRRKIVHPIAILKYILSDITYNNNFIRISLKTGKPFKL